MRIRKQFIWMAALIFLAAACAPAAVSPDRNQPVVPVTPGAVSPSDPVSSDDPSQAYPSPSEPRAGDEKMQRANVFIDSVQILTLESFPPQFMVSVAGNLPTPCHELRSDVSGPDAQNRIDVEVYSLVDPETICIQVLQPFQENINLGSFQTGTYQVFVNGEKAGEIVAP
jgi:hypothetical protein